MYATVRRAPIGGVILLPLFIATIAVLVSLRASERAMRAYSLASLDVVPAKNDSDHTTIEATARLLVPKCAQNGGRAQSFVMLFMGHSGSTALITSLQQHDEVLVTGFEPVDHGELRRNSSAALEYARQFFAAGVRGNRTAGFKLRPQHILRKPRQWAALFREHRTRIIWNYRTNIFKQAVGHYPIIYLNDTSAFEGIRVQENGGKRKRRRVRPFAIHNTTAFHRLLSGRWRGERNVERALAALDKESCVLPVSYELLLREPTKAQLVMQAFLGLRLDHSIRPKRAKVTSDNMCEVVTNWNEVCRDFFLCARWRPMMDDAENGCTCAVPTGVSPANVRYFCKPLERRRVSSA